MSLKVKAGWRLCKTVVNNAVITRTLYKKNEKIFE